MTEAGKSPRLRYDEGCLAAHALNVVGDRWALLVVRELMLRAKRFQAIRAGLPGITAGVLAQRLAQLVLAGVVGHDAELGTYFLTASGQALRPVLVALCHWGVQQPGHDPSRFISPTALLVSMMTMIDRAAAVNLDLVGGLVPGAESFTVSLDGGGGLQAIAGLDAGRQFTLRGDGRAMAQAVYGAQPLAALVAERRIALEGDVIRAQAFADLFAFRPAPALA